MCKPSGSTMGMAMGIMMANVPQEVPVAKAMPHEIRNSKAGTSLGVMNASANPAT